MKKNVLYLIILILTVGCRNEAFTEDLGFTDAMEPKDLLYSAITNAREFSQLRTGVPTVDTRGLIPFFEIVSIKNAAGTVLDNTFTDDVTIANPVEVVGDLDPEDYYEENGATVTTYSSFNISQAGLISIAEENQFDIGTYTFTIKVTTETDEGETLSATFEDALSVSFGPELVTNLLYSPIAQNLVVGAGSETTRPFLITGNPDVTFSLGTDTDKLQIDAATGIISLLSSYTTSANDTILPTVLITSTISQEVTEFQGDSFLFLVASNDPVDLPRRTNYFFYPTLEANNKVFGYALDIITPGQVPTENIWTQRGPSPLTELEEEGFPVIEGKQGLITNAVIGGASEPHESDVIINSQDLSPYGLGFDISVVFHMQNRFVEYLEDGRTPTELEVYISTDYTGNNANATWTKINDQVGCQINNVTDPPFIGMPYPGDQRGPDPDGRKDDARNADGRWMKCEFDLNDFKEETNFTIKFKFASFFEGEISGPTGRSGRYFLSDVYFKATEQE